MQSRHRNAGDRSGSVGLGLPSGRPDGPIRGHGMYNSNPNYRNFGRGGFNRGPPKSYLPPPPPRKADILMEAGRLAAEYLVFKGLLPPNSLPPKWPNAKFQEFKGQEKEFQMAESRTSALARLGNSAADVGQGRRRYNDEYDHMGSRNNSRGRRRTGPYNRGYGSEWGRDNGRNGPWMGRARGSNDSMEGEDDFAPGYHRDRGSGFDERNSRCEVTGESGSEVETHEVGDDSGSKASSSSTRKDPATEGDVDLNKGVDDVRNLNSETIDEVKSDASGDSKKKNSSDEDLDIQNTGSNGNDLLRMCSFAKVPTKPRSSLAHRSPKIDRGLANQPSNTVEVAPMEVPEVTMGEDPMGVSLSDSHTNQANTSKCQPVEESLDPQLESSQSPPGFGSSRPIVEVGEEINKTEGIKRQRDPSLENEYCSLHNLRAKRSSPDVEPMNEEMAAAVAVEQEKPVGQALFTKVEPELNVNLEEAKQVLTTSFKICDLNLMETPEITEIPDDPVLDNLDTSTPALEAGKELSVDFGLSIGNDTNDTDDYGRLSSDDKVVPVIDLEDDSPIEANACDPSKPKNETIYSSLDNFLSQTEHADLPGIQDGYSLAISEFLGSDMSGCPSVPSDLNNLQTGMGLHDPEGVPADDDSIYVSLAEIPIGFLEGWDQPPGQEYGKFF